MFKPLILAGLAAMLAMTATPALADTHNRKVLVTNETSFTIVEFYASRTSTDSWEEDMLGSKVMGSHETARFDFNDGSGACLFDFKIVFNDGDVSIAEDVNVCKISEYFIRE